MAEDSLTQMQCERCKKPIGLPWQVFWQTPTGYKCATRWHSRPWWAWLGALFS